MRKKGRRAEDIRRKQMHEILDLVLDINGLQASRKAFTRSHPTAFLRLNGHVGTVEVKVYRSGWFSGCGGPDVTMNGPFHGENPVYREQSLSEIIEALKAEKGR